MGGAATDRKLTKNEKRRQRKKAGTQQASNSSAPQKSVVSAAARSDSTLQDGIAVEYVSADYENEEAPDILNQFKDVFSKFSKPEELLSVAPVTSGIPADGEEEVERGDVNQISSDTVGGDGQLMPQQPLSKRKKKLLSRLSVAELKQLVPRPDVVEVHDVTSNDPRLLVYLKSIRNTVPVPRHWCHIRKYLTGKVGMEKPPFALPEFIAETGIAKIRDTLLEQEALKKAKQKSRERVRPKMGKIDIDYQVLHDAFFKYQTKPKLTQHGDLYYEGKEFELNLKNKKPGQLSSHLQRALGMLPEDTERVLEDGTVVTVSHSTGLYSNFPPPWLINMQRYGPPPSYSSLRIPGLNAPLPPGATYGYHYGGWGKPPVDEYGQPLYGNAFGDSAGDDEYGDEGADGQIDISMRWGALAVEEYIDTGAEDVEEEPEATVVDTAGLETPSTVDGLSSLASGLETPDTIDLRKRAGLETPDTSVQNGAPRELYHVIKERGAATSSGVGQLFGSDRTYVLPGDEQYSSLDPSQMESVEKSQEFSGEEVITGVASLGVGKTATNGTDSTISKSGLESELADGRGTSKKRKADAASNAVKRMKEFKF